MENSTKTYLKNGHGLTAKRLIPALIAALMMIVGVSCSNKDKPRNSFETAIIKEDWPGALQLCDKQYKDSSSAVFRALKGHIYLANNRNNASLEMFLSLNNQKDKQDWYTWCQNTGNEIKKNPVILYFLGDANARLGKWKEAIEIFNKAKDYKQQNITRAMILNALGVSYANIDKLDDARKLIEEANTIEPNFADAYASIGTINILQRTAKGASEYFQKALAKSNEFALAHNGKGCALYGMFIKDTLQQGIKHILIASQFKCTKALSLNNLLGMFNLKTNDFSALDTAGTSILGGSLNQRSNKDLKRDMDFNSFIDRVLSYIPKTKTETTREIGWEIGGGANAGVGKVNGKVYGKQSTKIEGENILSILTNQTRTHLDAQKAQYKSNTGEDYTPRFSAGGAKTEMLTNALVDDGNWKVTNWFGLAQNIK